VNEPVANACRTCGRWPSLFELEGSTLEDDELHEDEEDFEAQAHTVEVEELEPEVFEPEVVDVDPPPEFEADAEDAGPPKPMWQRLARLVVPIGVVLYVLVSVLADR
jgi:hypothetical protein